MTGLPRRTQRAVRMSAASLVQFLGDLEDVIGTGEEPDGLCGDKADHKPHLHDSPTLGRFWCTADQASREPYRSEQRRRGTVERSPEQGEGGRDERA